LECFILTQEKMYMQEEVEAETITSTSEMVTSTTSIKTYAMEELSPKTLRLEPMTLLWYGQPA